PPNFYAKNAIDERFSVWMGRPSTAYNACFTGRLKKSNANNESKPVKIAVWRVANSRATHNNINLSKCKLTSNYSHDKRRFSHRDLDPAFFYRRND
ncbi:MAG: hypothetical protein NTY50_14945, partial [Methylobacter sp.]|nr:hypothetical protein [Methylobacter sp.]